MSTKIIYPLVFLVLIWSLIVISCSDKESDGSQPKTDAPEAKIDAPVAKTDSVNLDSLANVVPDSVQMITQFVSALQNQDTVQALQYLVNGKEYVTLFAVLPENDGNPSTRKFMTSFHTASTLKHFKRWIGAFQEKGWVLDSLQAGQGEVQDFAGFSYVPAPMLVVKNAQNQSKIIQPFKTLLKTPSGYKILTIVDIRATDVE
jgi:hypothetical protein